MTGDPYVSAASSFGDRGIRDAAPIDISSFGGISKDRLRIGAAGRRGVVGLTPSMVSSFDTCAGSRNFGDGDRIPLLLSMFMAGLDGEPNWLLCNVLEALKTGTLESGFDALSAMVTSASR